MNLVSENTRFM